MDLKQEIARKRAEANNGANNTETIKHAAKVVDLIQQDQQDPDAIILKLNQIEVKVQGRTTFNDLEELALDIKTVGQLQPIVVKQIGVHRYRLIAGERRYRAISQILKRDTIRATIRRVDETEDDVRFVQLSENVQRDNYLPLELATELADLKKKTALTIEQLALRIGKSKGFVSKYINLLDAPVDVKEAIEKGEVAATSWFNNKDLVLQQLKNTRPGSAPPKTKNRNAMIAVSLETAKELAQILQILADKNGLASIDVDLSGAVTKKQLQAIFISRSNEVLESL